MNNNNHKSTKISAPGHVNETKLRTDSSNLIGQNKYADAQKQLQSLVDQYSQEFDYMTLASVQSSQYNYSGANKTLLLATNKFGKDYMLSVALAQNSITLKNNTQAIQYYKDALTSLQNKPSQVSDTKAASDNINAIINQLSKSKN